MSEAAEALRQVIEGEDFKAPSQMVSRVTAVQACRVLPGLPYSIATNVAHADVWNRLWLTRLLREPKFNPFPDFPKVEEVDWPRVRSSFLSSLEKAHGIATAEPFQHHCKSDEDAEVLLLRIAVHTSYHLGQIYLLKRALQSVSKTG
jgi:hypothetical protein